MMHMPINNIIEKIHQETGLSEGEIQDQIKLKLQMLEGLVSEEGAAYIIASELGVRLFKETESGGLMQIKNVLAGMQSIQLVGQITRVYEPSVFQKDGKAGQVGSFVLTDSSGSVRVVLWDNRVDWIKEGKLKEGTIIKLKDAYAKENIRGGVEVHLGKRSSLIIDPPGVDVSIVAQTGDIKKITELRPGESSTILATVVQVWAPNFYKFCPTCRKKVDGQCPLHKTEPEPAVVINFMFDDSTETIRSVAFGARAEKLIGLSVAEAKEIFEKDGEIALKERIDGYLLGRIIEAEGKVVENKAFERLEFQVSRVNINPNPKAIAQGMLKNG